HEVQAVAHKNGKASAPATVHFTLPDLIVESPAITEPKDTAPLGDARQPIRGTVPDADQVTLTESGKDLGPVKLTGNSWEFTPGQDWTVGSHEVQAVAHKNGKASAPATVHFTLPDLKLTVAQKFKKCWQKVWDQPQYLYSFELTINAKKDRIVKWTLSFGVDKGVKVDPDWAKTFTWATIVKDGSDGTVVIQNTDPTHTVDPHSPLPIDVLLLCPGKSTAYQTLHNPMAHEDQ
ncbi:hypothetical protein, partial [Streptomyces sp. DT9]